jgi:hypothetical protein
VVYVQKQGETEKVHTGDYLGDLKDELLEFGFGSYIHEFVSGGPKNFAFSVFCPSTQKRTIKCKAKGIAFNYKSSKIVNFEDGSGSPDTCSCLQSEEDQAETWR